MTTITAVCVAYYGFYSLHNAIVILGFYIRKMHNLMYTLIEQSNITDITLTVRVLSYWPWIEVKVIGLYKLYVLSK